MAIEFKRPPHLQRDPATIEHLERLYLIDSQIEHLKAARLEILAKLDRDLWPVIEDRLKPRGVISLASS